MSGVYWTEDKIEEELLRCIPIIGEEHFPTHSELIKLCNNKALAVAVSKHGGTKYWANKLNMPIRECESSFGNRFEEQAIEDIRTHTGLESVCTVPRYPYDIFTADCVKIDIKASLPIKGRNFDCWAFNLEKKMPTCDIYIFYCLNNSYVLQKVCVIPSVVLSGQTQVGIGSLSKYDNYVDQWNVIADYYEFYIQHKEKIPFIPKRRSVS